jgi:chorismate dehydratase
MNLRKKCAVPSNINKLFHSRKVDAGFISSATSKRCRCTDAGIVGRGRVYSVLLLKGNRKDDTASASSNLLAKKLGLKGEVMIGDRALRYYLEGKNALDLSLEWQKQKRLPFVFARLCYNKNGAFYKKIAHEFIHTKIRIPQYILKEEAKKRGISPKDARWYLEHIHYRIGKKERKALELFLSNR